VGDSTILLTSTPSGMRIPAETRHHCSTLSLSFIYGGNATQCNRTSTRTHVREDTDSDSIETKIERERNPS
jgi:hypothetical protein